MTGATDGLDGDAQGQLYGDLAPWFHLLTSPIDYADEATFALALLREQVDGPLETLLELGAGGGNTASHLKDSMTLTLADLSAQMLELSAGLNPTCEHVLGDMRTMRLGRVFDAVLIHDAICYMANEADLRAALSTAFDHLRPGGAAVFMPDHVRETFRTGTDHGGEDAADGRGVRYLEWITDLDPTDSMYETDYAVMTRDVSGVVRVHQDHRVEGLFACETWLEILSGCGFVASSAKDDAGRVVFVGSRPATLGGG